MPAKCFTGTSRNSICTTMLAPFWIKPKTDEIVFPPEYQWTEKSRNRNAFLDIPANNLGIGLAHPIRVPLFGTKYGEVVYIRQEGLSYTDIVYSGLFMANNTPDAIVYVPFWFIDGTLKDEAIANRIFAGIVQFQTDFPNTHMQIFVGVGENHPHAIEVFKDVGIDYAGRWNPKIRMLIPQTTHV